MRGLCYNWLYKQIENAKVCQKLREERDHSQRQKMTVSESHFRLQVQNHSCWTELNRTLHHLDTYQNAYQIKREELTTIMLDEQGDTKPLYSEHIGHT